jgi:hypothetical protein
MCKIWSKSGLDNVVLFCDQVRCRDRLWSQAKENWSSSKGGRETRIRVGQCGTDTTPRWIDGPAHNVVVVVIVKK